MTDSNEIVLRYAVESWAVGPGPRDHQAVGPNDFEVTAVVHETMSGDVSVQRLADVEIVPPVVGPDDKRGAFKLSAANAAELAAQIIHAAQVAEERASS